jgi:hypothetical protein
MFGLELERMRAEAEAREPEPDADLPAREPTPDELYLLRCNNLGAWPESWQISARGWPYINAGGFNAVVYRHGGGWAYRIIARTPPPEDPIHEHQTVKSTSSTGVTRSTSTSMTTRSMRRSSPRSPRRALRPSPSSRSPARSKSTSKPS